MFRIASPVARAHVCVLVLSCVVPAARAATYSVGSDPAACDFATLQLAVDAAATNPGPDTIKVAVGTYSAQAVRIGAQTLTVTGGYATCSSATPTAVTRLDGSGGSADTVIAIGGFGHDVRLQRLQIVGGDEVADGYGGGVSADLGTLTLQDVELSQNRAGYGGGLYAGAEQVVFGDGVRIIGNRAAHSGGGVRLSGSTLRAEGRDLYIALNDAGEGNGGGISAYKSAVDLGARSPVPVLQGNRAAYGGAISILGGDLGAGSARVRLYSLDPTAPVRLSGNVASATGGAIYLKPSYDISSPNAFARATLCASDFRLDDNLAIEGSAIYVDTAYAAGVYPHSGTVRLNASGDCAGVPMRPETATRCTGAVGCNSIDRNLAEDGTGAVITVQNGGELRASRVAFRDNAGGRLLNAFGDFDDVDNRYTTVVLDTCLVVDNDFQLEPFRLHDGGARLSVVHSTIAGNLIGNARVAHFDGGEFSRFALERSVVWQPGSAMLQGSPDERSYADLVVNEVASLPDAVRAVQSPPRFFDPEDGDYRLQAASPAVDQGTAVAGIDLAGRPRPRDLPIVANAHGSLDLGAFERQDVGNLVRNPEFPERAGGSAQLLRLWTATSALSTWSVEDAAGGRGSVYLSFTPDVTPGGKQAVNEISGLSQCIHIPGPGDYALSAYSRVPGSNAMLRDYARLDWTFRSNDASCTGASTAQGSHFLARSSSWSLAPAALIHIAPETWTRNSTIEIVMRVTDGNPLPESTIDAYFDAIQLVPTLSDATELFRDGFEN